MGLRPATMGHVMSLLERTRQFVPTPSSSDRPLNALLVAAGYGAVGALSLVLLLVVPVTIAWLADSQSTVSWSDALTFAPDTWVLAHRGTLGVPAGDLSVTAPPLLLTGLAVLLARVAAASTLTQLTSRTRGLWPKVALSYAGGYALTGVVLALVGRIGPGKPGFIMVVPGAFVVAAIGMAWALWRDHTRGEGIASEQLTEWGNRLPAVLVRALRPALVGVWALLAVGLLLVLVAVALSWGRVSEINGELQPGIVGGTLLTGAQLTAAPNFAAYVMAWLSGASIHLGSVSVGHAAITPGILPMVPVLGAVPEAGAGPWWAPFVPILPVVIGGFVGWRTLRGLTVLASLKAKVQTAAIAGVLSGVGLLLLAYVGSMGVGGTALDHVGPSLMAVPLLIAELVIGAVLTATVLHYWRTHR